MKCCFIIFLIFSSTYISFAQIDSTIKTKAGSVFDRISKSLSSYQVDTSEVPNDKITRTITALREARGGFNINEAIMFKLGEDRQKNEISQADSVNLLNYFSTGDGKKWLDNSITWIYRNHFSFSELKQLLKFYKTAAGKKMSSEFPLVMLQSLMAAEKVKNMYPGNPAKAADDKDK